MEVITSFLFGFVKAFLKRGITHKPISRPSQKLCHAHLHFIGIMYTKFHLNDLKTV